MTPRAAAIYARISSDPTQTHAGVDRQRVDCAAEAERLGWRVAHEYIDNDVSAYGNKPRPQYERMLADIECGAVDAVIVWHADRLHRKPLELEHFFQVIDKAGISSHVRSVTGNTDFATGDGILSARIMGAVAANESASKSRRIRRKKEELAAAGRPVTGGRRPFGYTRDQLHLDPVEAPIVRAMVERFLADESVRSITRWLHDEGIPTSAGSPWRSVTVRQILRSPRIAGLLEHRGEIIGKSAWPAIITEDQHRRVLALFAARQRAGRRSPQRHLLTGGLVRCGRCAAKMWGVQTGDRARRYVCFSSPDHGGCGRMSVVADPFEEFLVAAVLHRLDTPELARTLAAGEAPESAAQDLSESIEQTQHRLDELIDMFAAGEIGRRDLGRARADLTTRLQAAEAQLAALTQDGALSGLPGNANALRAAWADLNLDRQRAIVAAIVDHVAVQPGTPGRGAFDQARLKVVWRL